jgi:hypothetical protein
VAETFDFLNDANGEHVKPEHVWAALDSARTMRQVLVEAARRRNRDKRRAAFTVVTFDEALHQPAAAADDLVRLDAALDDLARIHWGQATNVEARSSGVLDSRAPPAGSSFVN